MEVDMPIIGLSQCQKYYKGWTKPVLKEHICAGHPEGGMDTCQVI